MAQSLTITTPSAARYCISLKWIMNDSSTACYLAHLLLVFLLVQTEIMIVVVDANLLTVTYMPNCPMNTAPRDTVVPSPSTPEG
jgi:hypothetical protein